MHMQCLNLKSVSFYSHAHCMQIFQMAVLFRLLRIFAVSAQSLRQRRNYNLLVKACELKSLLNENKKYKNTSWSLENA